METVNFLLDRPVALLLVLLVGALIGIAIRALGNSTIDLGIDNEFISTVSDSLEPSQSALFILTSATQLDGLSAALGAHNGILHHTSLSDEASAALAELADNNAVVQALDEDQA